MGLGKAGSGHRALALVSKRSSEGLWMGHPTLEQIDQEWIGERSLDMNRRLRAQPSEHRFKLFTLLGRAEWHHDIFRPGGARSAGVFETAIFRCLSQVRL